MDMYGDALLASLPLLLLILLMLGLGRSVSRSAAGGWLLASLLGAGAFGGEAVDIAAADAAGAWQSLSILGVVFGTLLLYAALEACGLFDRVTAFLTRYTADAAWQALIIGWLFVHVLQGVSGFGVPVLVGAPLLVRLGIPPVRAVLIALLGQCWGNTFGTLGLAFDGLLAQVALDAAGEHAVLIYASDALVVLCVVSGWLIAVLAAGRSGLRRTFLPVLALGIFQGLGQTALALWQAETANFLISVAALTVALLCLRGGKFGNKDGAASVSSGAATAQRATERASASVRRILTYAVRRTLPVAVSVMLLLMMSEVMLRTGQTAALARGTAALSGSAYPLAAPLIGLLGSFMTASNLSSNILFGAFQQTMAAELALDAVPLIALQTVGGAVGTLLSPSNILLGTTAVHICGQEKQILCRTIPFACGLSLAFGLIAWLGK